MDKSQNSNGHVLAVDNGVVEVGDRIGMVKILTQLGSVDVWRVLMDVMPDFVRRDSIEVEEAVADVRKHFMVIEVPVQELFS